MWRHPWQCEPGLPDAVVIAFIAACSPRLDIILQRNGRLLVSNPSGTTHQLEAAQACILELMNQRMDQEAFLDSLLAVCLAQQRQDSVRAVHWSRHVLACIARVTGAKGLIGCLAVTFHPHYYWFSSPKDEALGSRRTWPVDVCVLLLDAYPPEERGTAPSVWPWDPRCGS